jgi:hypothetical protein
MKSPSLEGSTASQLSRIILGSLFASIAFGLYMGYKFYYPWQLTIAMIIAVWVAFSITFWLFTLKYNKSSITNKKLFEEFKLLPNETVEETVMANHTNQGGADGGKLLFTSLGLRFIPHHININQETFLSPMTKLSLLRNQG